MREPRGSAGSTIPDHFVREFPRERGDMVRTKRVGKRVARKAAVRKPKSKRVSTPDALLAAVKGATHRYLGHVRLDVGRAGAARVKRMIYPAGFRWSKDMKPVVGTDLCM